jgi:uncharacterized protein YndB with AHSA1/START domain
MNEKSSDTLQVYRIYIKATPEAVWDAITKPEWNQLYGYGGRGIYDLKKGGAYRGYTSQEMKDAGAAGGFKVPELAIEGEVLECEPGRKLVLTWHMAMDEHTASDAQTRLTYEIEALPGGLTKLTLLHELAGAPAAADILAGKWEAQGAGGGWSWVLSEMKSLLETGKGFKGQARG